MQRRWASPSLPTTPERLSGTSRSIPPSARSTSPSSQRVRTSRTLATTPLSTTTRKKLARRSNLHYRPASSSSPNTSRNKSVCLLLCPVRGTRPLRAEMETLHRTSLSPRKCLRMRGCSITETAEYLTPWRTVPWKGSMSQDLSTLIADVSFKHGNFKDKDQTVFLKARAGEMRTPKMSSDSKSKVLNSP